MYYAVGREKRENHPDREKAVLYSVDSAGIKTKINVWKPSSESPKIPFEKMRAVPEKILDLFRHEVAKIREEEALIGSTS